MTQPWGRDEFESRVREVLDVRYHHRHPFHQRMHAGDLSREEIQDWVANRFCYQQGVVVKDAILLAKVPSSRERRMWIGRLIDQDGISLLLRQLTGALVAVPREGAAGREDDAHHVPHA